MKPYVFALLFLSGACAASPTAPQAVTKTAAIPEPVLPTPVVEMTPAERSLATHNIPATMPDGSVVWMCATQPRTYTTILGETKTEVDHYVQFTSCPDRPID